jgi:hypothetical protein
MDQVMAIENALFAGERLPSVVLPIAKKALYDWVGTVAAELVPIDEPIEEA